VWLALTGLAGAAPIKALIVDGHNNHDWRATTPVLKKALQDSGLFQVDVATAGKDVSTFKPNFASYQVVVSNYNGPDWPRATQRALVDFVKGGGGFVAVHAADNSFPDWREYNEMIGVGGWGRRNEKSGPYVRWREGKVVLDRTPGRGGSHGRMHEFLIITRDPEHPIMAGLPKKWKHVRDELYDRLRGPARNLKVLATAYSDKSTGGTGENEPMLMAVSFGKGRSFHTTLGHDVPAMKCVGFIVTLQRGAEWAATAKVTQKVPADFPTAERIRMRK
jgi:type 1 glutamine amidotransferase